VASVIVDGWYVPNTPSLLVDEGADGDTGGLEPRPDVVAALRRAGEAMRQAGATTVVVVTPHFAARGRLPVLVSPRPRQVYDFGGFPPPLYRIRYAPPGDSTLAEATVAAALAEGLPALAVDGEWGLDHGAWAPLYRMLPAADLPVVAVGIGVGVEDGAHEALGRVIARTSGTRAVAVVATGSLLHRLDLWDGSPRATDPGLARALALAEEALAAGDWTRVWRLGPDVVDALLPEGGFRPLRVLAGAVGPRPTAEILARGVESGAASLTVARLRPARTDPN
jgi:4,5-DOPA dioxygenase extradiol